MIESWCGIPQADLPYIFDRFYRVQPNPTEKSGRSRHRERIVEIHESRMEVDSTINVGTTYLSPAYCSD